MSLSLFRRAALAIVLCVGGARVAHAAETDAAQRAAFTQAYAAAQNGGDAWRAQAASLADYPLYPYLEAAALQHDVRQIDLGAVQDYLRRYPDWIPAADLRRDFLLELARRQDWSGFSALYQPGLGDTLACHALRAKLARGEALDFAADLASVSRSPSALFTAITSAISRIPFLMPWSWSPVRAMVKNKKVSTMPATVTSDWPTPTVSTRTTSQPAASSTRSACGVDQASPPRCPRLAIDRMKTPSSRVCSIMRMRSPRIAPPEKALDGSTATTPTLRPAA